MGHIRYVKLVGVAVTTALVGAVFCCLLLWVNAEEQESTRPSPDIALRGILLGLTTSDELHGRLPHAIEYDEAGAAIHSWRFYACRDAFGGFCDFYGQDARAAYQEPWDGPGNKRYYDGPYPSSMSSPLSFIDPTRMGNKTRFVAITGPGTAFDGRKDVQLTDLPRDLILVVEIRNSDQHWMEPGGDLDITAMPRRIDVTDGKGISGRAAEGFLVGFVDGAVWKLTNEVPFDALSKFFTLESARQSSRDDLLRRYRTK